MRKFKTVSWKITIIVMTTVLIVGIAIAAYMQYRLITEMDKTARSNMRNEIARTASDTNVTFTETVFSALSLRKFAEASFNVESYKSDAVNYFDTEIRPVMDIITYNIIDRSNIITAAYFAVHPDLAGYPLVTEVNFELTDYGIESIEPQSYEEYMNVNSEDMEWFYGAYNSGDSYWTQVYEWSDGEFLVSYVEPVIVGSQTIGVVGVELSLDDLKTLVNNKRFFDTGFALLKDNHDEFFETNDFIIDLNSSERSMIINAGNASAEGFFDITIDGIPYVVSMEELVNGYVIYAFAPRSEFRGAVTASLRRFVIIFVVALSIVIAVSYFIGKKFGKPLISLIRIVEKACVTGDVTLSKNDKEEIEEFSKREDEIGQSIKAVVAFMSRIRSVSEELEAVSQGDLTLEVEALSDADLLGNSLHHMNLKLNEMFLEVNVATSQVAEGAKYLATGSQVLAQGSTEQAASIEELSSSISEVARLTKENAETAERAASFSRNAMEYAKKGGVQMADMQAAVKEISDASESIEKIIKTIDEIAFQTNILALNAAVEAARAGQHGKGFAVVAEEVRSLAAKSAEAAKETGAIIQNSVTKAELGVKIANETSKSFSEIASGVYESGQLIGQVSVSLEKQSSGIKQINKGVNQVAQVVQQNSATAQESSAASQEVSSQSVVLQNFVSQFKLKKPNYERFQLSRTIKETSPRSYDDPDGSFGKC